MSHNALHGRKEGKGEENVSLVRAGKLLLAQQSIQETSVQKRIIEHMLAIEIDS